MPSIRKRVERAREQLIRRDSNAEDAPDRPDPSRAEIEEQERAVRDERRRGDED
jgi:hypothetical protein